MSTLTPTGVTVVHTTSDNTKEQQEDFEIGSLFASSFSTKSKCISVQVHPNTSLTLNMVTRQPEATLDETPHTMHLWYKQPNQPEWICFLSMPPERATLHGLDLTVHGNNELQFRVDVRPSQRAIKSINVFGTIRSDTEHIFQMPSVIRTTTATAETAIARPDHSEETKTPKLAPPTTKDGKKRKASHVDYDNGDDETRKEASNTSGDNGQHVSVDDGVKSPNGGVDKKDADGDAAVPQPLSKKQRRKLAQQKAKELADAISATKQAPAKEAATTTTSPKNGDATAKQDNGKKEAKPAAPSPKSASATSATHDKATPIPLTKPRRLQGGILVQDFLIGNGMPVKTGRNVSIVYEGRFPNGKVFDRNKNHQRPLSFRPGTGQVIPGLDQGMQGMKVGGKREITIPPELGYGKKGSPPVVPPNATLIFNVEVISAGGK